VGEVDVRTVVAAGVDPILAFYRREATDDRGRSLDEVRSFEVRQLERVHDYIQWLFPLAEGSAFNPGAPTLTAEAIAAFRADPVLQQELRTSLEVMLRFYGFRLVERVDGSSSPRVEESPDFADRSAEWVTPGNHNHRRITRILRSLQVLGLGGHAAALLERLEQVHTANGAAIGGTTVAYWRAALDQR
jgi:opioid growth factor receptor-like protein